MTWRAGPGGELMWRAGPPRGCDAVLRPRGRAAGGELMWRAGPPRGCDAVLKPRGRAAGGPREVQVAHRARTRGLACRVASVRVPRATSASPARAPGCHISSAVSAEKQPLFCTFH